MSDSKSSYGEPVEEPTAVDDVVGSANEGIAHAEAAGREAVIDEPVFDDGSSSVDAAPAASAPQAAEPVVAEPVVVAESVAAPASAAGPAYDGDLSYIDTSPSDDSVTTVYETPAAYPAAAVTAAEPVTTAAPLEEPAYVAPVYVAPAPQPIFVQAPEAPNPRGNRGAAGAIGLLAALSFAILYLAAWLGFGLLAGSVTFDNIGTAALAALSTWTLWVPVAVFFIAFWLLGAIINRGRWAHWVIFGLFVGIASYAGHILGALFQAPFWLLTARQGADLVEGQLLAPLAIAAFVIGRELTIWFGAWVAARGAKVTELNIEAQREYERTLEAGPQLTRV